jgi:hypothetical protein
MSNKNKLHHFKLKVAIYIVNANLAKTTTVSKETEDASERLDKAEEAFEFARNEMHRQNQLTYMIRKQRADSSLMIRMLLNDEFHLEIQKLKETEFHLEIQKLKDKNSTNQDLIQQLVDVKAKIKEQEGLKKEAENLLEIDTNFQVACAAFKKAEMDLHNARDAHEVAAINEMRAIQKQERLHKLLAHLTQELSA